MKQKGHALHIGLNKVDTNHYNDLKELACCVNDATEFSEISSVTGFSEIKVLVNEAATTQGFINILDEWSKVLVEGDLLWITYSGHGGQKPDINKDETDGWDETWCLYNRELVDDEQFELYNKFARGVRIVVFSDSCHSGTVIKGLANDVNDNTITTSVTVTASSGEWENYKRAHHAKSRMAPVGGCIERYIKYRDIYDPILGKLKTDITLIPAYVVLFAACKDEQESIEFGNHGYFTAVMLNVLRSEEEINSYNELFKKIGRADLGNNQNANLDSYGSESCNFLGHFPLSISGERVVIKKEAGTVSDVVGDDELIIHQHPDSEKARSRGLGQSNEIKRTIEHVPDGRTAWDKAYNKYIQEKISGNEAFVEPNIKSKYQDKKTERSKESNNYLSNWPKPDAGTTEFIWHLDENHSELKKAAEAVISKYNGKVEKIVRIGHIDTGYRKHISQPKYLNIALGRNFINGQNSANAEDQFNSGFPAEQDGHGCATLSILAGNEIKDGDGYVSFQGAVGAIPFAEVIPIRICETVYNLFNANDVASGIDYAVDNGCEVITMSMAGYPTKAVAEAVNRAYKKGVIIVTAAGNNWYEGIQKLAPKSVLYPARFARVIAATGACYDHFPYDSEAPRTNNIRSRSAGGEVMQGNWGPEGAMRFALAAYTPNLAWASDGETDHFLRNGGGTSSATPQVAAAAALWVAYNRDNFTKLDATEPWQKVEAARRALYDSASKAYPLYKKYYGNGIIRAFKALTAFAFTAEEVNGLQPAEKASVSFLGIIPFIKQWFRSRDAEDKADEMMADNIFTEMLSVEVMQLIHVDPAFANYTETDLEDPSGYEFFNETEGRYKFFDLILQSPVASDKLKEIIKKAMQ